VYYDNVLLVYSCVFIAYLTVEMLSEGLNLVSGLIYMLYGRDRRTFLGITSKYIFVQQYYPLAMKVRKKELISFNIIA
jgi:hypothetical protein